MSRCFPFPPPGYEKKAIVGDENLLKKEKQKEKKHKKEKDKEKREGKERKEKERSEEKHREKKERKDKHKDKKDKNKDKERKSASVAKDAAQPLERGNVEKPGSCPVQSCEPSKSTYVLELGKRSGKAAERPLVVQKFTLIGQSNVEMPSKEKGEDERKLNGKHIGGANGFIQKFDGVHRKTIGVGGLVEKSVEKRTEHRENDNEKNGETRSGKQWERDREKGIEGVGALVEKLVEKGKGLEEDSKEKDSESRGGKYKDGDREKKSESKDKKREKEREKEGKKDEKKEKKKEKELKKQREISKYIAEGNNVKTSLELLKERSGSKGNVGKRKEFGTNGLLHDNGSQSNKLPRLVSSTQEIVENGKKQELSKTAIRFVADGGGNKVSSSLPVPANGKILEPCSRAVSSTLQIMENGRKPESCKTTLHFVAEVGEGSKRTSTSYSVAEDEKISELCPRPRPVISGHEIDENAMKIETCRTAVHVVSEEERNNKVLFSIPIAGNGRKNEPAPYFQPVLENGRKSEPERTAEQPGSGNQVVVINHKVDNKEIRINGKEPSHSMKRPFSSSKQAKKTLPHPDCQFLSSILSVPLEIEWENIDDQDWLFGSELQHTKRPKVSFPTEETAKQVWAEALRIESADIIALPYVVPL